jgi:hypothetical protein
MIERSGASEKGFHFLESFKSCKRKWFFRFPLGLEPDRKPFQLIFGGAFHHGKATFYSKQKVSSALAAFKEYVEFYKKEVEDPKRYIPMMLARGPVMLEKWIRLLGRNDIRVYKILALEEVIEFRLPNGYLFTIKPDVVLKGPGGVYIFDTKTSWYSSNLQSEQLETSDQTTAYIYGWNKKHPDQKAVGLVPDCISWNVNSSDPEKIDCTRSRLVTRSERELEEWALGTQSDLADMASRVAAVKKFDDAGLFPRTTSYCLSYNRKCEYLDICRHRIKSDIPEGFHESSWPGKKALLAAAKRWKA